MTSETFDHASISRPDKSLMKYYIIVSILTGPGVLIAIIPLWLRYLTLKYQFDDEGVSMRWGVLFRREIYLTYRRLQDIHLTSNVIERWMGLSKISLQTASGNSGAEMTIEGVLEGEQLRDYLYTKMRGVKNTVSAADASSANSAFQDGAKLEIGIVQYLQEAAKGADPATQVLIEIRDALKKLAEQKT